MKERETFGSRLGFILVSAGCAIGLGNVWKFPYMTGKYGGAAFVLIYLAFLVVLGLPILVSEFAVGRASRKSTAKAFHELEPEGSNFHKYSYMGMIGNYMLMMFYTMVAGWTMYYCYVMASGKLAGAGTITGNRIFWEFPEIHRNYDILDGSYFLILQHLFIRSSEGRGEDHQGYDALSSCSDHYSCHSLCDT